jgi:hypothetical protein
MKAISVSCAAIVALVLVVWIGYPLICKFLAWFIRSVFP